MHPAARPPRSSTFARAPTRVTSNDARVRAATLSPSRMRPRKRCSVPRKPWLRNRASSCARMTARHPLAVRSSNTAVSLAPRASLRRLCLGVDRARHRQGGDRAGFAVSNTVGAAKRECALPRSVQGQLTRIDSESRPRRARVTHRIGSRPSHASEADMDTPARTPRRDRASVRQNRPASRTPISSLNCQLASHRRRSIRAAHAHPSAATDGRRPERSCGGDPCAPQPSTGHGDHRFPASHVKNHDTRSLLPFCQLPHAPLDCRADGTPHGNSADLRRRPRSAVVSG